MEPRQSRLDVGLPEIDLAQRWANYRVLRKSFVSATALASFHHCPVKPFLERVLQAAGLDRATWAMRQGLAAHEAFQSAATAGAEPTPRTFREALHDGSFLVAVEYPLRDERRMLRGIADVAFAAASQAHIVELKNARPPPTTDPTWGLPVRPEHALQLELYGLLAREDFGATPTLTLVYMQDASKADFLESTRTSGRPQDALEALVESHPTWRPTAEHDALLKQTIRELRRAERRPFLPQPTHGDPARCGQCTMRAWCPRRLDRPGEFQHVSAALLERAT